jgi:hypothetical protein
VRLQKASDNYHNVKLMPGVTLFLRLPFDFDLIFSKMVFEHISGAEKAYLAIRRLQMVQDHSLSTAPVCVRFRATIRRTSTESSSQKIRTVTSG